VADRAAHSLKSAHDIAVYQSSWDQRKLFVALPRLYIAKCTVRTVAVFMTLICRAMRRALKLSP
jgi:hypothetical protein